MGNTMKMNSSKVVQREIIYQISLLKFWIKNMITELRSWAYAGGGYVKGKNVNGRFERKINTGLVLGVPELVEKHSSPNILTFQHEKNHNFCSKKSILSRAATSI